MTPLPLSLAAVLLATPAMAHDFWIHGEEIPAWVKADCCGQADAHHMNPSAVHLMADGYHLDGVATVVPIERALPSQDGSFWAFFNEKYLPDVSVYCLFVPFNGA